MAQKNQTLFFGLVMPLVLYISCTDTSSELKVERAGAALSANISKLTPLVAKPGEIVKIIGTGFATSNGAYGFFLPLLDGTIKPVKISISDSSNGSFTMPEGAGLGLKTVDFMSNKDKISSFSFVADQPTNTLPIFIGEASEICSSTKYVDKNGDTKTGTKDCLTGLADCQKDGEIGCKTTASFVGANKATAIPSNIRSGVSLAGVTGTLSASGYEPDAWDLRAGVTVGSVTGKLFVNCRNRARSAVFNYDGAVSGLSTNAVTSGTTFDYWDTIDDYNAGTVGVPSNVITGWTANDCGGIESVAGDSNVWKDVTTAGSGTASCTGSPENCTMKDKITGLHWSKQLNNTYLNSTTNNTTTLIISSTTGLNPNLMVSGTGIPVNTYIVSVDSATQLTMSASATASASNVTVTVNRSLWNGAVQYCDALTYNGASDWRLPTQKELMEAYNHGAKSAASANWITDSNMFNLYLWSATTVSSGTNSAWYVGLAYGNNGYTTAKNLGYSIACVR